MLMSLNNVAHEEEYFQNYDQAMHNHQNASD